MQVVYIDSVFFVNALIDCFLLLATGGICGVRVRRARLILSAALGGLYAAAGYLPGMGFLLSPLLRVAFGILIALAAFGGQRSLLRPTLTLFAVAAAFGGVAWALALFTGGRLAEPQVLIPALLCCCGIFSIVFRRAGRRGGAIAQLTLIRGGRCVRLSAMADTGNSLTDPLTGSGVAVAGADDLMPLFEGESPNPAVLVRERGAVAAFEALEDSRFRLVPYSAVGVEDGLLLAFRPDEARLDGRPKRSLLVAVSPNNVSDGGAYRALIGAEEGP